MRLRKQLAMQRPQFAFLNEADFLSRPSPQPLPLPLPENLSARENTAPSTAPPAVLQQHPAAVVDRTSISTSSSEGSVEKGTSPQLSQISRGAVRINSISSVDFSQREKEEFPLAQSDQVSSSSKGDEKDIFDITHSLSGIANFAREASNAEVVPALTRPSNMNDILSKFLKQFTHTATSFSKKTRRLQLCDPQEKEATQLLERLTSLLPNGTISGRKMPNVASRDEEKAQSAKFRRIMEQL